MLGYPARSELGDNQTFAVLSVPGLEDRLVLAPEANTLIVTCTQGQANIPPMRSDVG